MTNILIGADPEFPIMDRNTGKFVSPASIGFKGTKENPVDLCIHGQCKSQVDGLALEFNITPSSNRYHFLDQIEVVKRTYNHQLKIKSKEYDMDLVAVYTPLFKFDQEYFDSVDPDNKVLGCSPDYSKDGEVNPTPSFLMNIPQRTAAGHIHIGWTEYEDCSEGSFHFQDCVYVAQHFDALGLFNPKTDVEKSRLKFYGGNGAFRPKPYGIELRSPSNTWLEKPSSILEMFDKTYATMSQILKESA